MSSDNSPILMLDLPGGWQPLLPAGVLAFVASWFPWLAFAWTPAMRAAGMVAGLALALGAAWQSASSARRITRVVWNQSEWRLHFAMGEPLTAVLTAGSWQARWLMCWRWTDARGRSHGLLLWRTQLAPGDWHRWQLRLRLEGHQGGATLPQALP